MVYAGHMFHFGFSNIYFIISRSQCILMLLIEEKY